MEKEKNENIKEAIRIALSYPGDYACKDKPEEMCPVTSTVSDQMLLVDNKKHIQCPHYLPFGYSGFCNLPARKEIYNLYGI